MEHHWKMSQAFKEHLDKKALSCFGTQLIENVNSKQTKFKSLIKGKDGTAMTHYRRPETSYRAAIIGGVVDKVHRFDKLQVTTPVTRSTFDLPNEVCQCQHSDSHNLAGVASYSQTCQWHSPTSASSGAAAADLDLVDYCMANDICCFVYFPTPHHPPS